MTSFGLQQYSNSPFQALSLAAGAREGSCCRAMEALASLESISLDNKQRQKFYLVAGDERGDETKCTCHSQRDLLWSQLKKPNSHDHVHGGLDQSQEPFI
jgi:hypothetical protein